MIRFSLALFICFYALGSRAQVTDTAAVPTEDYAKTNHYIRLNYENDFFNATDFYYTQGINLEFIAPFIRYSPFSYSLIRLNKQAQNYYGLALRQECFTPSSIRHNEIFYGERPYAATGVLTHELISIDSKKKRRLTTQLDLGAVGPCAACEEEQKGIHRALVNIQPLGWQFQVSNDFVINYNAQFEQGIVSSRYVELIGYAGARVGTLYDDANVGAMLRVGFMPSYFDHLGIVKNAKAHKFQLYFTGQAQVKGVAYNATLQGGMFNRGSIYTIPGSQVARYVLMGSGGLVLACKRVSLEYNRIFISPEITGAWYHGWGSIVISVCF